MYYGIRVYMNRVKNIIMYNKLMNNTYGVFGIYITSNKINYNNFHNNTRYGVYLGLDSFSNDVMFNLFAGNNEAVRLKGVAGNTVTNNIMKKPSKLSKKHYSYIKYSKKR